MKKTIGSLILLLLFVSGKPSELNVDSEVRKTTIQNIDWLLGSWKGTGQLFGNEATFMMSWEKALNDQFIELNFQNSFLTKSGANRTMNATALYKYKNDSITGHWFDTRGTMLPLSGIVKSDTLTIFWGDDHTEQGKTLYQKVGDQIETEDYYLKEGEYHQFGNATYRKHN